MEPTASSARRQYQPVDFNVYLVAWSGQFVSSLALLGSAVALYWRQNLVQFLIECQHNPVDDVRIRNHLTNFVIVSSYVFYVISLINVIVCSLLLVGIRKRCSSLFFPWLLYHGLLFGVGTHLALYLTISGFFVDFSSFMLALTIYSLALILFFKIFHEVFMLFKVLDKPATPERRSLRLEDLNYGDSLELTGQQVDAYLGYTHM